ncbi:chloride channel protein [Tepidiforma bonchosmolovskayae]|uniref:Chloride channel protein n=1 Tax=Tepidiforma bonchosmolovskayae TaxID=2601677 RepID=A0ABX6C199_9CHLR|nr:chloride channel protein [Tepidiforma bonchosmolovskayae]QFG02604.1 chloride channel protein [Tepidiforma bonchosmolovskayae]
MVAARRSSLAGRRRLTQSRRISRAVWLGVLIGLAAGAGSIAFHELIGLFDRLLLGGLAGYHPPMPLGDGGSAGSGPDRAWALPLVIAFGGLASGLLTTFLAPEAAGHGTDNGIRTFHWNSGRVRWPVIPVKLLASAITIGSGGAAGPEGPNAQVGGGLGSLIADRLGLEPAERRRALAAGIGAGIGAIFRAPLGGAMMAAEVLYKHDLEADVILLALISSITAYALFGAYTDFTPIFGNAGGFAFSHPGELPYYALLGLLAGLAGLLFARVFYGTEAAFHRLPLPTWAKPALGGAAVGAIGIAFPEAIHVGYGWVQQAFTPAGALAFSPWLLLALPFLRILTTSLTVGSGGSGGIFGPGMVIGGLLGAAYWRLGHTLPGFPQEPGPVVIIGMTALFGAIAHVPLSMLLMVAEMTGNLSLLAPAMAAVAIATLVVGDETIYRQQPPTRADSPAHRHRFAFPLLSALPARQAAIPLITLDPSLPAADALARLREAGARYAVTILDGGAPAEVLAGRLEGSPDGTVARIAVPLPAVVQAEWPLDRALDALAEHERRWLPVVDTAVEGAPIIGQVDARALLRAYRRAASQQLRPLNPLSENIDALDVTLTPASPLAHRRLADVPFPPGARVAAVERGGQAFVPRGELILLPGDRVTVTFLPRARSAVIDLLAPPAGEPPGQSRA